MLKGSIRALGAVALLWTWLGSPAAGQSAEQAKLLDEIKAKDSGQLAVSEEDGHFLRLMVATSGAKRALEIGGASGYSAIWIGLGLRDTGGRLTTIEVRSRTGESTGGEHRARGALGHRDGRARRRVQGDPETERDVRLRLPRRLEARLSAFLRRGLPEARSRRALHRPQCREQAQRDGRLPGRHPETPHPLDDDRLAVGRRNVDIVETLEAGPA